jgi:hypothetical protein
VLVKVIFEKSTDTEMHPGFNIIMRLNTTKQWMRLMWQYDTSVIIALRLKLSMTVWQKNRQARLAILCVKIDSVISLIFHGKPP